VRYVNYMNAQIFLISVILSFGLWTEITPAAETRPLIATKPVLESDLFFVPQSLKDRVMLWEKIYSEIDSHQVMFYDQENPKVVYDIQDLPKIKGEISSPKYRADVEKRRDDIKKVLADMAAGVKATASNQALYERIQKTLRQNKLSASKELVERVKYQNGLKSQFGLGIQLSGKYIGEMQAILRAHGLPPDLVAIAFVESLFYISSESSKGAMGAWGLMPETAKLNGIFVNSFVMESACPVTATEAAASYLKKAYAELKNWPLAIMSYNYGLPGTIRAVNNLGTNNIEEIIAKHDSPIFGYASKNYYAEVVAARNVLARQQKLFPDVKPEKLWQYDLVQVLKPVSVPDLISVGAVTRAELATLNPSFSKRTLEGLEVIVAGYSLRVPEGRGKKFYELLRQVPANKRIADSFKISSSYRADGKETLRQIAKKFGLVVDFLTQKMGQAPHYKPKGTVLIRSVAHGYTPLSGIAEKVKTGRPTESLPEKPASLSISTK
jgi:membrane-bound lytic murein transglycosylase D